MIHPNTELRYINEEIGYGVFATEFIPKGTITWTLDDLDQILSPDYVASLDEHRKKVILKYSYRNQHGQYVYCWDNGKFVNHSFHANCMGTAYECEVAIRDIYPGEQLTDEYGTLNIEEPFECFAEEGTDRKLVMPDDLLHFSDQWDQQVLEAFKFLNHVEQPLLHLVQADFQEQIQAVIQGKIPLNSIKNIYCDNELKIR